MTWIGKTTDTSASVNNDNNNSGYFDMLSSIPPSITKAVSGVALACLMKYVLRSTLTVKASAAVTVTLNTPDGISSWGLGKLLPSPF